jgi:hypothetical protein
MQLLNVKSGGIYSYQCALKCLRKTLNVHWPRSTIRGLLGTAVARGCGYLSNFLCSGYVWHTWLSVADTHAHSRLVDLIKLHASLSKRKASGSHPVRVFGTVRMNLFLEF